MAGRAGGGQRAYPGAGPISTPTSHSEPTVLLIRHTVTATGHTLCTHRIRTTRSENKMVGSINTLLVTSRNADTAVCVRLLATPGTPHPASLHTPGARTRTGALVGPRPPVSPELPFSCAFSSRKALGGRLGASLS